MAKLKTNTITAADMEEFVKNDSDFGFEMEVLALLTRIGYECQHSGTYRDPVTDKIRQFDIRARKSDGDRIIGLAVECKNFRENNPLLVSSVPRLKIEAFHNRFVQGGPPMSVMEVQHIDESGFYPRQQPVGKKTDQVGREISAGALTGNDEATFDKLSQAINSCADLVADFASRGGRASGLVVPVLVVPDERLWQVDYDSSGQITAQPRKVDRSTYFLNHTWSAQSPYGLLRYNISHIEIMTFRALQQISERFFDSPGRH